MATRIRVPGGGQPRIIVDCTHTFHTGAGTGIQRVVRHFADALLDIAKDTGHEVVPARVEQGRLVALPLGHGRVAFPRSDGAREAVSATAVRMERVTAWRARGALLNRLLRSRRLGEWLAAGPNEDGLMRHLAAGSLSAVPRDAIEIASGDILLSLDSSWVYDIRTVLEEAGRRGATRIAVLCDVLPLSHPEWFTEGTQRWFRGWLEALLPRLDGVVTISEATRGDLLALVSQRRLAVNALPPSRAVHLGAEIESAANDDVRPELRSTLGPGRPPAFLTVGTLEPRKNADFALDLFDELLSAGHDIQWHIVGSSGWLAEGTTQRIRGHPEHGARLHWWTNLRDAELAWCYRNAAALVAVSKAEGFGLPLVEARYLGLPVFASDIPVFREVLGSEGRYLPLSSPKLAAATLDDFLRGALRMPARSDSSPQARTWLERTRELLDQVLAMHRARATP